MPEANFEKFVLDNFSNANKSIGRIVELTTALLKDIQVRDKIIAEQKKQIDELTKGKKDGRNGKLIKD